MNDRFPADTGDHVENLVTVAQLAINDQILAAVTQERERSTSFQRRVQPWMLACFGEMIAGDREERNHRFLEEALELVQACGCTASEARQLVDYVYGRPVGDPPQEVGGVMVTLAALCLANDLDMHACGETELARIWTKVEAIRAKQAAKPKHSPLPVAACAPHQDAHAEVHPTEVQILAQWEITKDRGGFHSMAIPTDAAILAFAHDLRRLFAGSSVTENRQVSDPIGEHNAQAAQRKLVEHAQAAQPLQVHHIGKPEPIPLDAGLAIIKGGLQSTRQAVQMYNSMEDAVHAPKAGYRVAGNAQAALNDELPPLPEPDYPAGCDGMLGEDCWTRASVEACIRATLATRQPAPTTETDLTELREKLKWSSLSGDPILLSHVSAGSVYYAMTTGHPAPVAATRAQGDHDSEFAQFCDREGYPSDGPFDAALRKAFDAGRAAHPSADAAPAKRPTPPRDLALCNNGSEPDWMAYAQAEVADAAPVDADVPEALELLSAVFDAWENGDDCWEDPENHDGYLGMAFRLDDDVFQRCCALLNRRNPPRNAAAQPSTAQGEALSQEAGDAKHVVAFKIVQAVRADGDPAFAHLLHEFDTARGEYPHSARMERMAEKARQLGRADGLAVAYKLAHHLTQAHAFVEGTEAFGRSAASGILQAGQDKSTAWDIDQSKADLSAVAPRAASQPDSERDAALEQMMIEHRIAVLPEYEGGFNAGIYGDEEAVRIVRHGKTPSEAVAAAMAAQQGEKGGA